MNLPQAHCHKTTNALFFTAPLKGWRGVWLLGWVRWQKRRLPFYSKWLWYWLFNIMTNYVKATAVGCLHKRWVALRSEHIILHYVI